MAIFSSFLMVLQVLSAFAVIILVLLQHGKGADMGAAFGSGSSGSLFGATGAANFLSRSTAVCATIFFLSTLGLSFVSRVKVEGKESKSVMESVVAPVPASSSSLSEQAASGAEKSGLEKTGASAAESAQNKIQQKAVNPLQDIPK